MQFVHEYFVHFYETNVNRKLTLPALMQYFEDIAILQSEAVGLGLDYYIEKNVGWLLFKWDIRIKKMPSYSDKIKLITTPFGFKRYYAYRKYEVLDSNGETIIEADSIWLLIDTNARKPIQIFDEMYTGYGLTKNDSYIPDIEKMEEISSAGLEKHFTVYRRDIDINGHVNNVTYIQWVLETLPDGFVNNNLLKRVKVIYKKETMYGKDIKSLLEIKNCDNTIKCLHKISDENDLCMINTEWLP